MLELAFYKIYVAIVPTNLFFVISPRYPLLVIMIHSTYSSCPFIHSINVRDSSQINSNFNSFLFCFNDFIWFFICFEWVFN